MGGKKSKMVFEPSYSAMLNDETILYPQKQGIPQTQQNLNDKFPKQFKYLSQLIKKYPDMMQLTLLQFLSWNDIFHLSCASKNFNRFVDSNKYNKDGEGQRHLMIILGIQDVWYHINFLKTFAERENPSQSAVNKIIVLKKDIRLIEEIGIQDQLILTQFNYLPIFRLSDFRGHLPRLLPRFWTSSILENQKQMNSLLFEIKLQSISASQLNLLFSASYLTGNQQYFLEQTKDYEQTLIIIKTDKDKIMGGYSSTKWELRPDARDGKQIDRPFIFYFDENEIRVGRPKLQIYEQQRMVPGELVGFARGFRVTNVREKQVESTLKTSEYDIDEGSAKLDNGVLCIGGGESSTFKFKSIECFGIK